jgi:hypothetical protein
MVQADLHPIMREAEAQAKAEVVCSSYTRLFNLNMVKAKTKA